MDNRETYWVQDTERRQAKQINTKLNKGNAKRGVSPRLKV